MSCGTRWPAGWSPGETCGQFFRIQRHECAPRHRRAATRRTTRAARRRRRSGACYLRQDSCGVARAGRAVSCMAGGSSGGRSRRVLPHRRGGPVALPRESRHAGAFRRGCGTRARAVGRGRSGGVARRLGRRVFRMPFGSARAHRRGDRRRVCARRNHRLARVVRDGESRVGAAAQVPLRAPKLLDRPAKTAPSARCFL